MRKRVTAVFAAIVTAFVALDAVVLFTLWPQVHHSEHLGTERAEATELTSHMQRELRVMTMALATRVRQLRTGASADAVAPSRSDFEEAASRFRQATRDYAALPINEAHRELWQRLSNETFPAFLKSADHFAATAPAGGAAFDAALQEFRRVTRDVDLGLEELSRADAQALLDGTMDLHDSVHRLALLCLALGAVGVLACALGVRWALKAVREYERSTRQRMEELDAFAGRVAHDLRNPLQTISMALAIIRQRATDEGTLALCGKAQDSVKRASRFIQELLAFARSGARPDPSARANVEQVLRSVQQDLAAVAERHNVQFRVEAPREGWAAISPEALQAVIANLADNAVKYMPAERAERLVEISARKNERDVEIQVRDTGAGISPEALPRVFDGFYRATELSDGFGIGLATVKRLVEAHGGRTTVKSEVGGGSQFTVILPAASAPMAAAPNSSAGEGSTAAQG